MRTSLSSAQPTSRTSRHARLLALLTAPVADEDPSAGGWPDADAATLDDSEVSWNHDARFAVSWKQAVHRRLDSFAHGTRLVTQPAGLAGEPCSGCAAGPPAGSLTVP